MISGETKNTTEQLSADKHFGQDDGPADIDRIPINNVVVTESLLRNSNVNEVNNDYADEDENDEEMQDGVPADDEEELLATVAQDNVSQTIIRRASEQLNKESFLWPDAKDDDFQTLPGNISWPDLQTTSKETVMEWVKANNKLLIRTVTWNMQAKKPPPINEIKQKLIPEHRYDGRINYLLSMCKISYAKCN